jgi:hypothetical protein
MIEHHRKTVQYNAPEQLLSKPAHERLAACGLRLNRAGGIIPHNKNDARYELDHPT